MKHRGIQNDLIFYLDGELASDREQEIRKHLQQCASCRELLNVLQSASVVIAQDKQQPENPFFYAALKAKMEHRQQLAENRFVRRILQPAFFSVLLLAGVSMGIYMGAKVQDTQHAELDSDEILLFNEMNTEPIESYFLK